MAKEFPEFFEGLSEQDREALARAAKTTVEYIRHHLIAGRRLPRVDLLNRLIAAAGKFGGRYTNEQLMACFLKANQARAAA